jgi:hypothetical protein
VLEALLLIFSSNKKKERKKEYNKEIKNVKKCKKMISYGVNNNIL